MSEDIKPVAQISIKPPSSQWTVYQGKTFTVQIYAWHSGSEWKWNVYALIFEGHPCHQNLDAALSLPFHCGPTSEKRIITSPAGGIKYDWQKVSNCLKIGSDYSHYGDYYENDDPKDGIPTCVHWDAQQLAQELLEREHGT